MIAGQSTLGHYFLQLSLLLSVYQHTHYVWLENYFQVFILQFKPEISAVLHHFQNIF
jgi:hypothetical protein